MICLFFTKAQSFAIQVLEKSTQQIDEIKIENEKLKKENDTLKEMFLQLRKEMDDWKKANNKNL